ncbi:hypothetical protein MYA_2844 [Burkholderia sp. KJ006]|nr:hypothetical protein MYA_2844 [Burkholderia sp. KJ006]
MYHLRLRSARRTTLPARATVATSIVPAASFAMEFRTQ